MKKQNALRLTAIALSLALLAGPSAKKGVSVPTSTFRFVNQIFESTLEFGTAVPTFVTENAVFKTAYSLFEDAHTKWKSGELEFEPLIHLSPERWEGSFRCVVHVRVSETMSQRTVITFRNSLIDFTRTETVLRQGEEELRVILGTDYESGRLSSRWEDYELEGYENGYRTMFYFGSGSSNISPRLHVFQETPEGKWPRGGAGTINAKIFNELRAGFQSILNGKFTVTDFVRNNEELIRRVCMADTERYRTTEETVYANLNEVFANIALDEVVLDLTNN